MKLLALLHRWTGGFVGILLVVIGLTGTLLVWEDSWIMLDGARDAPVTGAIELGRAIAAADAIAPGLSRITFAGEEIGLHQAIYADGSGAYLAQDGSVVDRWTGMWERPELWLFDLHHHLLMGETGKTLTGILGLLLLAFTITGAILWWRTRRTFRFRLWPARSTASAIVRHHRDMGVVASPLLLIVAATGTLMVFPAIAAFLLSPIAAADTKPDLALDLAAPGPDTDWVAIMASAQAAYPAAAPRRLTMPAAPGEPIALRFLQDFEWTPNGRSYVWIDPASAASVAVDDPAQGGAAAAVTEKFYPIHAAKVGGLAWRIASTFAGLALVLLGALASWSFWRSRIGDGGGRSKAKTAKRRAAGEGRGSQPAPSASLPG